MTDPTVVDRPRPTPARSDRRTSERTVEKDEGGEEVAD